MTADEVAEHVLARSTWRYSRASGPGGQNRDHAETRAELIVATAALDGLPPELAGPLATAFHLKRRPLRLASQADRSRERNRTAVEAALRRRVAAALVPRRPRTATRPTTASVARRLDQKARRARVKSLRRPPDSSD